MWRKIIDVLFWISAAMYFGGMVAVGAIVAPAVFDATRKAQIVLPGIASPPLDGTTQAGGEIFGEVLYRFAYVEYAALGVLLLCLLVWLSTTRSRSTWVMAALWAIVLSLTLYDSLSLTPRVWSVRATVRQEAPDHAQDGMEAMWPARLEFNQLHARAETLGHVKVYALLGMIVIAAWRGSPYRRRRGAMLNEAMRTSRGR